MIVMHLRQVAIATLYCRGGPLKVLACSAAHAFQAAEISGDNSAVRGCVSMPLVPPRVLSHQLRLRRRPRVRDTSCCQYISGNKYASIQSTHIGVKAIWLCASCLTPCHHTSITAAKSANCLRTLSKNLLFEWQAVGLHQRLQRRDLGRQLLLHFLGTLGYRVFNPPGMHLQRDGLQVPPVRLAHLSPVFDPGFAGRYLGLADAICTSLTPCPGTYLAALELG